MSNEEYFRFRVEDDSRSDLFSIIWKGLLLLLLALSVVVLAIWGYKLITEDKKSTLTHHIKTEQKPVIEKKTSLKREELAIIIKAVLEQMKKEQESSKSKSIQKSKKQSEDSKLLHSLQKVKVDKIKRKKPIKKIKNKKLVFQKAKEQIIKKKIVYNAVIINKKEVRSTSDLARLYASINKISRSKKKKILRSAYTKKIKKEIIIRKNSMRTIRVKAGDTLSSIALRAYGDSSKYNKIIDANPNTLSDPNNLRVGQVLRVPK